MTDLQSQTFDEALSAMVLMLGSPSNHSVTSYAMAASSEMTESDLRVWLAMAMTRLAKARYAQEG